MKEPQKIRSSVSDRYFFTVGNMSNLNTINPLLDKSLSDDSGQSEWNHRPEEHGNMARLVNFSLDIAMSGLEVAANFVTGIAPVAPICKIILSLAPLALSVARSFVKRKTGQEKPHVE